MIRILMIVSALVIVKLGYDYFKKQLKEDNIERMSPDELVQAVISKDISILDVPRQHRDYVNKIIAEVQGEMDSIKYLSE